MSSFSRALSTGPVLVEHSGMNNDTVGVGVLGVDINASIRGGGALVETSEAGTSFLPPLLCLLVLLRGTGASTPKELFGELSGAVGIGVPRADTTCKCQPCQHSITTESGQRAWVETVTSSEGTSIPAPSRFLFTPRIGPGSLK